MAVLVNAACAAGRSAKQALLYTEIAEGMNAYGVTKHRHMPEIEQVTSPGSALTHDLDCLTRSPSSGKTMLQAL